MPRHIEQPAKRHSPPNASTILSIPSASASSRTRAEPGTTMTRTPSAFVRPLMTEANARRSSMREFVHEPMKTASTRMSLSFVPGSARVRLEAEAEGIDKIVEAFGGEWRFAGCSMCLGMNPDQLAPGERCASTSNRNFEGRQGKGGRTHLVSPLVAAATAVRGTLSSPWDLGIDLPTDLAMSAAGEA